MAITQKQLAKELGVVQVTVSRALRHYKGVKESLRRRILNVAAREVYSIEASNQEARLMPITSFGILAMTASSSFRTALSRIIFHG